MKSKFILISLLLFATTLLAQNNWSSKLVFIENNKLLYRADDNGNYIPDFSAVGYHSGAKKIPAIKVVKTLYPPLTGDAEELIQQAVDEVARLPLKNGFRGAVLLKKGIYKVPGTIRIHDKGIVLRGEGDTQDGTVIIATGDKQRTLIDIRGNGKLEEISGTRSKIIDSFVPAGAVSFRVQNPKLYKKGDRIVVYRPATEQWIKDLKMDQIEAVSNTRQWKASEYHLSFERIITRIEGNLIHIENPIVMPMEEKYGGGEIFKYSYDGRISEVGVENICFKSEYKSETDEEHGWTAINFNCIENGWVRHVTSWYFGFGCVNIDSEGKNITVKDSKCFEAKSLIIGSRRYSFTIVGQLCLVLNCESTDARHAYATGMKTRGPNVFYNCSAVNNHNDIGPHLRWSVGTLYDNVTTDGEINVQDRGNWGTGHGWAGATHVLWNCKAGSICVQSPWVSANNYCIGCFGVKNEGRLPGRPDGEWEGHNKPNLLPESLFVQQRKVRKLPIE